jgi:hypothetical protein
MRFDLERSAKAVQWLKYASEFRDRSDPYGEFFASWIALVIIGKDYLDHHTPNARVTGDREPLNLLWEKEEALITNVARSSDLEKNRSYLASRQGGQILKADNLGRREKALLKDLSVAWKSGVFRGENSASLNHQSARANGVANEANALLELLLQIRNGLFHGSKLYNDGVTDRFQDDQILLSNINPLVQAIANEVLISRT